MKKVIKERCYTDYLNDSLVINIEDIKIEDTNIEEEKKEECVICFEIVDEDVENFKFDCEHKKYMHHNCIKRLSKCPMCRTPASIVSGQEIVIVRISVSDQWVFGIMFTGFCTILFMLLVYPMIEMTWFSSGGRYNSTSIENMTNMTNITSDIVF